MEEREKEIKREREREREIVYTSMFTTVPPLAPG